MQGYWAREFTIYLYIGPMVQAEDERLFEEDKSLTEETMLINKKVSFGHNGSRR